MSRYRPDPLGVYYSAASRRDAEQTRARAAEKIEAKLIAQGKHPDQERAKYDAIMQERRGLRESE